MARRGFGLFFLIIVFGLGSVPSAAQGVVVNPDVVMPRLKADLPDARVFYVNGDGMTWSGPPGGDKIDVGAFQKTLLALVTLRLVDSGTLSLDMAVSSLVPDIVPPEPFRAPITIKHLLQETAGFASPPESLEPNTLDKSADHAPLKKFAIVMRSPGQVSSHDPVGWAILIAVLEKVASAPVEVSIQQQLLHFLYGDTDYGSIMQLQYQSLGGQAMPLAISMKAPSLSRTIELLVGNRDWNNELFLAYQTYQNLILGRGGHQMHPADRIASYGIQINKSRSHYWLEPLNADDQSELDFMAFPAQGAVFGAASTATVVAGPRLRENALELAREFFPPRPQTTTDGQKLVRPSKLEGRYIPAGRSPAGLSERLAIMQTDWLTLYGDGQGGLLVKRRDGAPMPYRETAPYAYAPAAANAPSSELLFSPYRLGGYVALSGTNGERQLFRRVDSLGRAAQLAALMPWALLVIASAGFYAFRQPAKPWRNMGLFALSATALVSAGLYLELNSWATAVYTQDQPALVTLWRSGLNIGLMFMLALPMFVVSFSRNKTIPTGGLKFMVGPHLALVAAAALMVFLTLVMWGVAGTFAPY